MIRFYNVQEPRPRRLRSERATGLATTGMALAVWALYYLACVTLGN